MLPTEVICKHCGRDAANAAFKTSDQCAACYAQIYTGRAPILPQTNKPTLIHTCRCGQYKTRAATQCVKCARPTAETAEEKLDAFNVAAARRDLVCFLRRHGFAGNTVPTT